MKRLGAVAILVLAFCGLADTVYLAQHELAGTPLLCNIQNLDGCNTVVSSSYSRIFGVPLSEFGVLFYAILFVLAALELVLFDRLLRRVLQGIALACALASVYFVMLQLFFIKAFCVYCLTSAVITLLILVVAILIEPVRRKRAITGSQPTPHSPSHLPMPPKA